MTLQQALEKLCGIWYEEEKPLPEEQHQKVKCDNLYCASMGRKPVCYMEWFVNCNQYDWRGKVEK